MTVGKGGRGEKKESEKGRDEREEGVHVTHNIVHCIVHYTVQSSNCAY